MIFPKDSEERKKGSKAEQILYATINVDHWIYRQETGNDVGRDCVLELIEEDEFRNHKIEGQIKGVSHPTYIVNGEYISFPLEVKTINYALSSNNSFILFLVDLTEKIVRFQCVQQHFIDNTSLYDKLLTDQKTINIRIPTNQVFTKDDSEMQLIAKRLYKRDGLFTKLL